MSGPVGARSRRRRSRGRQQGAVTAELALGLPLLLSLTIGLVWLLGVGLAQIRMVDAAREAARSAARGDAVAEAVARGEQVAPPGATVAVDVSDGEAVVTTTGSVRSPGGILGFLPTVTLHAQAVWAVEGP